MKALRNAVLTVLDKVDEFLVTEPARAIGYGAAVVVFLVVQLLNARGITRFGTDLSFEEAVAATAGAIVFVGLVVESIRKFVYAPQTYIEDLADTFFEAIAQGHEEAHFEELEKRLGEELRKLVEEAQPKATAVPVGRVKPSDKQN